MPNKLISFELVRTLKNVRAVKDRRKKVDTYIYALYISDGYEYRVRLERQPNSPTPTGPELLNSPQVKSLLLNIGAESL